MAGELYGHSVGIIVCCTLASVATVFGYMTVHVFSLVMFKANAQLQEKELLDWITEMLDIVSEDIGDYILQRVNDGNVDQAPRLVIQQPNTRVLIDHGQEMQMNLLLFTITFAHLFAAILPAWLVNLLPLFVYPFCATKNFMLDLILLAWASIIGYLPCVWYGVSVGVDLAQIQSKQDWATYLGQQTFFTFETLFNPAAFAFISLLFWPIIETFRRRRLLQAFLQQH